MSNIFNFYGRNVVVTGGTNGIGYAVAQRLLRSCATVCIWGREENTLGNAARMLHAADRGIMPYVVQADVRVEESVSRAVAKTIASIGKVDALINCAGAFGPAKSALAYTGTEWDDIVRWNLTSTFLVCREFLPHMIERGYGRVVNLASVIGRDAANPMAPAYSAAKAGVIRFTQALARDVAKSGVLVNCVAPSAIAGTSLFKDTPPEQVAAMVAKVPMGRMGTVEEVAELICWLASEGCSYSTGAVFDCSGGRHE